MEQQNESPIIANNIAADDSADQGLVPKIPQKVKIYKSKPVMAEPAAGTFVDQPNLDEGDFLEMRSRIGIQNAE